MCAYFIPFYCQHTPFSKRAAYRWFIRQQMDVQVVPTQGYYE